MANRAIPLRGGVSYVEWTWDEETQELSSETKVAESPTLVTTDSRTLNAGWYVVKGQVTFSDRVTTKGDVHLILTDGSILTALGGIGPDNGSSNLFIYGQEKGTGRLITGEGNGNQFPGIGPALAGQVGKIAIHGGNIVAAGENGCAGIGLGTIEGSMEGIAIYDGTITADGGDGAAGIGCGNGSCTVTEISVCGGSVYATGRNYAAGIGCGRQASVTSVSIQSGIENGVIRGVENADGTRLLQATRGLTRSEMAAMMNNAVEAGVLTR